MDEMGADQPNRESPFYGPTNNDITVPFLFRRVDGKRTAKVYMTGVSAFRYPDVKRIVVTEKFPILVPIYTMSAGIPKQLWVSKSKASMPENRKKIGMLKDII